MEVVIQDQRFCIHTEKQPWYKPNVERIIFPINLSTTKYNSWHFSVISNSDLGVLSFVLAKHLLISRSFCHSRDLQILIKLKKLKNFPTPSTKKDTVLFIWIKYTTGTAAAYWSLESCPFTLASLWFHKKLLEGRVFFCFLTYSFNLWKFSYQIQE